MHKVRFIHLFTALLLISISTQAQKITFASVLDGVNSPMSNSFQEELKNNNFSLVNPYKSRAKPESWAYNMDQDSGEAEEWVYYYFDRVKLEKKQKKTATVDITVKTYGHVNLLHNRLRNEIKKNCEPGKALTNEVGGYQYTEYIHSSGAIIQVYSVDEENYIKVRNTATLVYQ